MRNIIKKIIITVIVSIVIGRAFSHCDAKIVAYWDFEEGQGSTVADSAGDNTGVLGSDSGGAAPVFSGDIPPYSGYYSIEWQGSGHVRIGADIPINAEQGGSHSIAMWIKPQQGFNSFWRPLIGCDGNTQMSSNLRTDVDSKVIGYNWAYGPEWVVSAEPLIQDEWTHVTYVVSTDNPEPGGYTGRAYLYVNGELSTGPVNSCQPNLLSLMIDDIGAWMSGGEYHNWWVGKIDEVAIWDTALTEEQVMEVYQFGVPSQQSDLSSFVVAYYSFEEGSGSVAVDHANGYDGVIGKSHPSYNLPVYDADAPQGGGTYSMKWTVGGFVDVDYNVDITGDLTNSYSISLWAKATSGIDEQWRAIQMEDYSGAGIRSITGGYPEALNWNYGPEILTGPNPLPVDTWTHITWVIDTSNPNPGGYTGQGYLYIDGGVVANGDSYRPGWNGLMKEFCIGTMENNDTYSNWWLGNIDEVIIFSKALNADEVQEIYTNGLPDSEPILQGDFNRDKRVDFTDFAFLARHWLKSDF